MICIAIHELGWNGVYTFHIPKYESAAQRGLFDDCHIHLRYVFQHMFYRDRHDKHHSAAVLKHSHKGNIGEYPSNLKNGELILIIDNNNTIINSMRFIHIFDAMNQFLSFIDVFVK